MTEWQEVIQEGQMVGWTGGYEKFWSARKDAQILNKWKKKIMEVTTAAY